jgi:hypothetical protein
MWPRARLPTPDDDDTESPFVVRDEKNESL